MIFSEWTLIYSLFSLIFVLCVYLQGSIHAVSSFRVLTDGRLTAVSVLPSSKWENPTTQFLKPSRLPAGFKSGRISKGFVLGNFPISPLSTLNKCASLHCYDSCKCFKY